MRIKECPVYSRPYEKFEAYGATALNDVELLAILIRSGSREHSAIELSEYLLGAKDAKPNLLNLYTHSLKSLQEVSGIGNVKAIQILSLLELSKRLSEQKYEKGEPLNNPRTIAGLFMERLRHQKKEYFIAVYLDAKCKLLSYETVSEGSLTASIVHPREVYKGAITQSAHSLVVVHNHPSGDPVPSKEDIQITKRLQETGKIVGICLLDHIVIGDSRYLSFKEQGYL